MHRRPLPPARTLTLFARTVHKQLRQAGYDRTELVALLNELIDLILAGEDDEPLSGVSDSETSLANADAVLDGLAFEMRRARDLGTPLLVALLEIEPPDWCPDEAAWALHARVAKQLRRGVRPGDLVGRLGATRYAVVLPGAPQVKGVDIITRLVQPILAPRRAEDRPPMGTRVSARTFADDGSVEGAADLLTRCEKEPATPILGPREAPTQTTSKSTRPPPPIPMTTDGNFVLALGGGAARAAAHIGVLRALEDARIGIAGIAGTSAGAIVGAMHLSGLSPSTILERFEAFMRSSVYAEMRRSYVTYRRAANAARRAAKLVRHDGVALLSSNQIAAVDERLAAAFIEFFVGKDRDVSTLSAPFAAAATDLVSGRPVWITSGPLHAALRASCALPGLFPPHRDGERLLVDGAVLAEVPVMAARQLGRGLPVLAVHLARPERANLDLSSSEELVIRASAMTHKELVREQLREAGLLLTAKVEDIGWLDFRRAARTAAIGEEAARTLLAERATSV